MKRLIALCLCFSLLLCGCSLSELSRGNGLIGMILRQVGGADSDLVAYEDMKYARPDMERHDRVLAESCETARTSHDLDEVTEAIYAYYDIYDWFYTNYSLAYIAYNRDYTSAHWDEEYTYCSGHMATVDAGLDALYRALAQSPIREKLEEEDFFGAGFFDGYEGEPVWDDRLMELLAIESERISAYYDLATEADSLEYYSPEYFDRYAEPLCQALIDLVQIRQDIALYMGYGSYDAFAYDFYYYRDYTPEQAAVCTAAIRDQLSELYRQANQNDIWYSVYSYCSERQTFAYLEEAAIAMGGGIAEAFQAMADAGLYDISHSENKFPVSFEIYLDAYYEPYVFICPEGYEYDKLTFAHEFGHFAVDYASWGSYAGTDVQEIFSQAMEFLSLCYVEDVGHLESYKLADCLSTFVEQAAYADFEHALYSLSDKELTTENVFRLYEDICRSFGIDFEAAGWDPRDLVTVSHFYTDPMYVISYVVSNDAAYQIYQMEKTNPGAGLAVFEANMATEQTYFLEFLKEAGLESPFDPDHSFFDAP